MTTFLELYGSGDTLADRMRAVARGTVVVDVAKGLLDDARESLREAADEETARTGTAFTARLDGVTALVTDPQPKPRVTDDEFVGWFRQAGGVWEERTRVEVLDADWLRGALAAIEADPRGEDGAVDTTAREALVGALKIDTEYVLPADPFTPLADVGRIAITPDGVIDTETGEHVPGTTVSIGRPTLQVRLDKHARADATRQVRAVLGIPAEVTEGAA